VAAAVKGFKAGVRDGGTAPEPSEGAPQQVTAAKKSDANTVDVEAKTKS